MTDRMQRFCVKDYLTRLFQLRSWSICTPPHRLPAYASAVLGPGGLLVISTPYHGFLKNLVLSIFNAWDAHLTALWCGGHIKFWSRKTLTTLLTENGFHVSQFHGVGRVPYLWKSMVVVARKR